MSSKFTWLVATSALTCTGLAACQPPGTGLEPKEPAAIEEPPRSAPQPETPSLHCLLEQVALERRHSAELAEEWLRWINEMKLLEDQFRYTPWGELSDAVKTLVETKQQELLTEQRARVAIEQHAAVSSIVLDVHDLSNVTHQEELGLVYTLVLNDQLKRFVESIIVLSKDERRNDSLRAAEAELRINEYAARAHIYDSLATESDMKASASANFAEYLRLLPRSAVIPKMKTPVRSKPSATCSQPQGG